jgi:hypothetical protein
MRRLRLYYRLECHLCEDMLLHLERLRKTRQFDLELVDVDSGPGIREAYQQRLPVLEAAEGQCLSEYFLDEAAVLNYLQGV